MKHLKKHLVLFITLAVSAILLTPPAMTFAAQKKNVYVVTGIKVKEKGKTTKIKITYTDKGLIKKINGQYVDRKIKEVFTYNSKNQLIKKTGGNRTYSYDKKGRLVSMKEKVSGGESTETNYSYNSKGQIVSSVKGIDTTQYTCNKKGHVKKAVTWVVEYNASEDKKGNISAWTRSYYENTSGYYKADITYDKSGRVKKIKRTYIENAMQKKKRTQLLTFTYKKISVPKSLVKMITQQQWQLINDTPGHGLESFAW